MQVRKLTQALTHLKRLLGCSDLTFEYSGSTRLFFNRTHDQVVRDYYLYVVSLFEHEASKAQIEADIVFGAYPYKQKRGRQTYRVDFQIEHTLVKPGGRGADHFSEGKVPILGESEKKYLVRIHNFDSLCKADFIVEYSRCNLVNLELSGQFNELIERTFYLAPLVYPLEFIQGPQARDLDVITLFGNPEEPRRKALLDTLKRWNPVCQNIRGRFDDIHDIYRRTRILVNIRQTDHHDTLEELRVLPALLSGVVVISEDVPLRSEVPYRDFILWTSLQDLPALVREVHENYAQHHKRIFSGSALRQCLSALEEANRDTARQLLAQLEAQST